MVAKARCLVVLIALSGVSLFASDNEDVTALELETQSVKQEHKNKGKGKKTPKLSQMKPSHRVDNLKDLEQGMSDGEVLNWVKFMKQRTPGQRRLINQALGDGMPSYTMTRAKGVAGADSVTQDEEGENVPLLQDANREVQQQALMEFIDGLERDFKQREDHLQRSADLARELHEKSSRLTRCAIFTSAFVSVLSTGSAWALAALSWHRK